MTSNINPSTINVTFPASDQNNDSQGFRDNFSAIQTALAIAGSEISNLQSNTLSLTGPVRSVLPVTIGPDTVVTTAFKESDNTYVLTFPGTGAAHRYYSLLASCFLLSSILTRLVSRLCVIVSRAPRRP